MSRWETTSTLEAAVDPGVIWDRAYADVAAWPRWNAEIKSAGLDGPLSLGTTARIVFRTGLRLRFHVVEYEQGRLFTDEARLPGARLGHRHLVDPIEGGDSRLVNTIARTAIHPTRRFPETQMGSLRAWPTTRIRRSRTSMRSAACSRG